MGRLRLKRAQRGRTPVSLPVAILENAADEMVQRTSTADTPWIIIPGNDKYYARIDKLEHTVNALKARIV